MDLPSWMWHEIKNVERKFLIADSVEKSGAAFVEFYCRIHVSVFSVEILCRILLLNFIVEIRCRIFVLKYIVEIKFIKNV